MTTLNSNRNITKSTTVKMKQKRYLEWKRKLNFSSSFYRKTDEKTFQTTLSKEMRDGCFVKFSL